MKKSKFIIGILVLALMLMGAGYASWTQTFSVFGSADTGKLEVTAEISEMLPLQYNDEYMGVTFEGIVDPSDENHTGVLTATIDRMYPGAVVKYKVKVTNVGTLPVKLDPQSLPAETFGMEGILDITVTPALLGDDFVIRPNTDVLDLSKEYIYTITFDSEVTGDDYEEKSYDITHRYHFIQWNSTSTPLAPPTEPPTEPVDPS
jgi:hypothetical protein